MKKICIISMLVSLAFFQVYVAYGQEEPTELTNAKKDFKAETEKAVKQVNDRYLPKLEELKKQLTLRGDIKGALVVEETSQKMAAGQEMGRVDSNSQEFKVINKNYDAEMDAAIKPLTSLYIARLEVLKQQLALGNNLRGALAVEKEMETMKSGIAGEKKVIKDLLISAKDEGTRFTATSSGTYRFTIVKGAYGNAPPNHPGYHGWETKLFGYVNRPIAWVRGKCGSGTCGCLPGDFDYSIGDDSGMRDRDKAENNAVGQYLDMPLKEKDYVIWVIDDNKNCFDDNAGNMVLKIELMK
jgi:hypothetical protein